MNYLKKRIIKKKLHEFEDSLNVVCSLLLVKMVSENKKEETFDGEFYNVELGKTFKFEVKVSEVDGQT